MSNNTGKPAFPIVADSLTYICDPGMTLRDYFAAKAMQGMIGDFDFNTFAQDPLRLARWSYQAADAMLKAREEKPAEWVYQKEELEDAS